MVSKVITRSAMPQGCPAKGIVAPQPLRFGELKGKAFDVLVSVRLAQSPLLVHLLEAMETAISQKKLSIQEAVREFEQSYTFQLSLAGMPVELTRKPECGANKWLLSFPAHNIRLTLMRHVGYPLLGEPFYVTANSLDGTFVPYTVKGFWAKRRIYRGVKRLEKLVNRVLAQHVLQQQQVLLQESKNGNAKTTMKHLLQTQIDLLTAKQDHYQPMIQNLERQYTEAQTHTEMAKGKEQAEALREQLTQAQEKDREHRQDTLKAIAELQEKQVRLELTENNEALLRMMDESKALIQASEERMQSVGPEIDVNYETTRILLAPNTSEATARVQERVQARLTEPAPTPPSALEQAIAAATSKSRQTEGLS